VWADRYSRKLVIARSAFVETAVFAGLALSQNRYEVAASVLLVGFQLGNSGVMLSALRAVVPRERLGLAISIFGLTGPVGFALGPALGGVLVDHGALGLHGLFLLDAALSTATGSMLLLWYREVRPETVPFGPVGRLAWTAVQTVMRTPITRTLFVIFGLAILGNYMAGPYFPFLVQRLHPAGSGLATAIGLVFGLSAGVGGILSPVAGLLGDRFGFRRVLAAATVVSGASLAFMTLAPNLVWLTAGAVVFGAGIASGNSMVFALLATIVPEGSRSATLNLAYVPLYIAGIIGGSLGAVLVRGGLNAVILTAAALLLSAGVVTLLRVPATPPT
jgi:MFS family permease